MTDPAIEPESGESYKVLFERMKAAYLDLLKQIRDLLDGRTTPQ
jgi:hypothetical protein